MATITSCVLYDVLHWKPWVRCGRSSFRKRDILGVSKNRGVSPKMDGVLTMENPIKMDDLGIPLFLETPIWDFTWSVEKNLQGSLTIFACFRSGSFEDDDFPAFPRLDMWSFPGFRSDILFFKTLIFESFWAEKAERTFGAFSDGRSVVLQLWGADLFLLFYLWSIEIFWLLQTWCGYISCEPWLGQPWWWKRLCLWKLREKWLPNGCLGGAFESAKINAVCHLKVSIWRICFIIPASNGSCLNPKRLL